jgi:hypothetical protein
MASIEEKIAQGVVSKLSEAEVFTPAVLAKIEQLFANRSALNVEQILGDLADETQVVLAKNGLESA